MLRDTVTLLCKTGLYFKSQLKVQGLLGITIDDKDVFIIHMNEVLESDDITITSFSPATGSHTVSAPVRSYPQTTPGRPSACESDRQQANVPRLAAKQTNRKRFQQNRRFANSGSHLSAATVDKKQNDGTRNASFLNVYSEAAYGEQISEVQEMAVPAVKMEGSDEIVELKQEANTGNEDSDYGIYNQLAIPNDYADGEDESFDDKIIGADEGELDESVYDVQQQLDMQYGTGGMDNTQQGVAFAGSDYYDITGMAVDNSLPSQQSLFQPRTQVSRRPMARHARVGVKLNINYCIYFVVFI